VGTAARHEGALRGDAPPYPARDRVKSCPQGQPAAKLVLVSRPERQFPRYAHAAEVTIRGGGDVSSRGRTSNLSKGGLCATVGAPFSVGTVVDTELALVFGEDSYSEPIALPARVVWCTNLGGDWQVGLSFRGLPADQLRYLELFLRFLAEGKAESKRAATAREEADDDDDPDPFAS
jgi:hypothetical protein